MPKVTTKMNTLLYEVLEVACLRLVDCANWIILLVLHHPCPLLCGLRTMHWETSCWDSLLPKVVLLGVSQRGGLFVWIFRGAKETYEDPTAISL